MTFQNKNNQNIQFIHQNQQKSSFTEKCCTSDQFLTIFLYFLSDRNSLMHGSLVTSLVSVYWYI